MSKNKPVLSNTEKERLRNDGFSKRSISLLENRLKRIKRILNKENHEGDI